MGGRNAKKRLLNILCTSLDIWAGIWCESVEWERVANGLVMGCAKRDGNVEQLTCGRSAGGVGDCILGAAIYAYHPNRICKLLIFGHLSEKISSQY